MKRLRPLNLEYLESRLTPASLTWPNASLLTVSFVPDGTLVNGSPSQLFSMMGPNTTTWENEILRGLQAWAANTNIDLNVVPDDGEPLGAAGPLQGSPNYGDIRIAAAPLSNNNVSFSTPFNPLAGTMAGDIIFNPNYSFNIGGTGGAYDIFTVALHEAGHVYGLSDQTSNQSSAMYAYYEGPRTGPSNSDIAAIQSLYGAPTTNTPGSTPGSAIVLAPAASSGNSSAASSQQNSTSTLSVQNTIAQLNQTTFYRYTTTRSNPNFTINLITQRESLLEGTLAVYNAWGQKLQTISSSNPRTGKISLSVLNAQPNTVYWVTAAPATMTVFGVGNFLMQVVPADTGSTGNGNPGSTPGSSPSTAIGLSPLAQSPAGGSDDYATGTLTSTSSTVYYKVTAGTGFNEKLSVLVYSTDSSGITPTVTLLNANQNPVQANLTNSEPGWSLFQVTGVNSGASFFVGVSGGVSGTATAGYAVSTQFVTTTTPTGLSTTDVENGVLTDILPQDFRSFTVYQQQLIQLQISATSTGTAASEMEVAIYDSNGNILYDTIIGAGQSTTVNLFLTNGTYTMRFSGGTADGSPLLMGYEVDALAMGEPLGPGLINPLNPPPPPQQPSWLSYGVLDIKALFNPYGRPYGTP